MIENYKAILFDLDGTLINSMEQHYLAWSYVLGDMNININSDEFYLQEGTNVYQLMSKYTSITDDLLLKDLVSKKDNIFLENYSFSLYPGVCELFERIKILNIQCGLVTASSSKRLFNSIPKYFLNNFKIFITSDDFGPGKPNPWPYRQGLLKIKEKASNTLVFENAKLGVQSARGANLTTIAIGNTSSRNSLRQANLYFNNFIDFIEYDKNTKNIL